MYDSLERRYKSMDRIFFQPLRVTPTEKMRHVDKLNIFASNTVTQTATAQSAIMDAYWRISGGLSLFVSVSSSQSRRLSLVDSVC
ncbi:hypothetical protein CHS0354_017058 [Potamilus streckersoni]|uniref:Uncharacterized protein n=1 Tax=Potamilus streckersoni TaxID=2493646 RepID=A0AAE0S6X6_9BIVA|nr:hypothetical protein CHS0354_017058 [Potamilus streckersoni]